MDGMQCVYEVTGVLLWALSYVATVPGSGDFLDKARGLSLGRRVGGSGAPEPPDAEVFQVFVKRQ